VAKVKSISSYGEKTGLNRNHPLLTLLKPLETTTDITFENKSLSLLPIGPDKYLWVILSGCLMGLRGNAEGDTKGTGLNKPGDILGLTAFSGVTKEVPFYALSDTRVKRIPTKDFVHLMRESPDLSLYMVSYLSGRYTMLMEELESTLLPLSERIRLFKRQMESIPSGDYKIPKRVIAFAVGAHPVSVSRLLNSR
jgi:CRP-like cAMP-binding protein